MLLAVRTLEHELNNKLAVTVGWSQMLAENAALPESLQRAARETLRGATEAAGILRRLEQLTEIKEQQWGTELGTTIAVRRSSERAGPAQ